MRIQLNARGQKICVGIVGMLMAICVAGCATARHYHIDKNYTLGRKYYEAGRYKKAIEYYLQHTAAYPDSLLNEVVFYHLGRSYQQLKDYENARLYYQRLIDKYEDGFWPDLARKEIEKIKKTAPAE